VGFSPAASDVPLPLWITAASPLVGPVVLALGYAFFIRMLRTYTSPGS
jgi:ABC-type uncharacterized transport system permease subunit